MNRIYSLLLVIGFPLHLAAGAGPVKAVTRGVFSVRYTLVRSANEVRASNVRVSVANRVCFYEPPSSRLREHERVHSLINDTERQKLQRELSGFHVAAKTLKQGEKVFLDAFKMKVREVENMHRSWDANHTFPVAAPK